MGLFKNIDGIELFLSYQYSTDDHAIYWEVIFLNSGSEKATFIFPEIDSR
jgi:hypothetical protein